MSYDVGGIGSGAARLGERESKTVPYDNPMIIRHEDDGVRGTWYFANGNGKLMIHCPRCGSLLINEYGPRRVELDGRIPHRVTCANEDCPYEDEEMMLEGWNDRRKSVRL